MFFKVYFPPMGEKIFADTTHIYTQPPRIHKLGHVTRSNSQLGSVCSRAQRLSAGQQRLLLAFETPPSTPLHKTHLRKRVSSNYVVGEE